MRVPQQDPPPDPEQSPARKRLEVSMSLMLYTEAPRSAGAKLSSLEPFGFRDQYDVLGSSPRPSIRLSSVNCKLSYGLITSK